jgi:hypothetical protein
MNQNSYDDKLHGLTDIFQGDAEYAKNVLDKWLQTKKVEIEAEMIAEVSRRLEGMNSIVPITFKVSIDSTGIHFSGEKPRPTSKAAPSENKAATKAGKKNSLFEPQG